MVRLFPQAGTCKRFPHRLTIATESRCQWHQCILHSCCKGSLRTHRLQQQKCPARFQYRLDLTEAAHRINNKAEHQGRSHAIKGLVGEGGRFNRACVSVIRYVCGRQATACVAHHGGIGFNGLDAIDQPRLIPGKVEAGTGSSIDSVLCYSLPFAKYATMSQEQRKRRRIFCAHTTDEYTHDFDHTPVCDDWFSWHCAGYGDRKCLHSSSE